ncbi:MAG: UvrD-helicase domain-containing protein [Bacteroidota bacterium]
MKQTQSFTVYRSSAGSGKTFTLVKEYLKVILLEPGDFRHILAITFTNKAANEMKERVLHALGELAKYNKSTDKPIEGTLLQLLVKETGLTTLEIAQTASRALEMILHNYADFAIGTIDSFSHKLIRTFAHDFGLALNFNIELDADELISNSVDLLLDRVGDDQKLTKILVNFLEARLDEEQGWNIDEILSNFAHILLDEEGQTRISKLKNISLEQFQTISATLYIRIREFEQCISKIAKQAAELINDKDIPPDAFFHGASGIGRYFENLAAGRMEKLEPNSYVVTTVEEDKWFSGKALPSARVDIDSIKAVLLDIYENIQTEIAHHKSEYLLRKLLAKTIYPLSVLNEIEKVLNDLKRQNNIVHISEFNARIAAIVMNEPVPFIYERLGEKYRHILIDEFQDTSVLQWMNFIPLIENSLAGGFFNLVVGDGKQAIYRWRSGDVEQFNALPAIPGSDRNDVLSQREESLTRHFEKVSLDHNFRSKTEIVAFNNRFFRVIADRVLTGGKEKIFEGLEQLSDVNKTGGYISLEFLESEKKELNYEEISLARVLSIILEAKRENFMLRDMAILCRSNKNASAIARFLLEQGVDVVSSESLLIANSPKVRFIIAFLRFLFEPPNDIVIAEIGMHLNRSVVGDLKAWESVHDSLVLLPVYDLCEELIRKYNLNNGPDIYLQFFLDAVLKFSVKVSTGAVEFIDWWNKNKKKLSIVVPEGVDAVKVMTIHKAKGLQFPLVILPFAQESRKNTKAYIWVDLDKTVAPGLETAILRSDKEMESTVFKPLFVDEQQKSMLDLVNVLYVAMTRPEERLYILTKFPQKAKDELDSLPLFFDYYLKNEGNWVENQLLYEFGSKVVHFPKVANEEISAIQMVNVISSDWRNKIEIRLRAPEMWEIDQPSGKVQLGKRIHTLLSWIKIAQEVPLALEKGILTGLIEHHDRDNMEKILWSVVTNPLLERFFSDQVKVKTEAEIITPQGSFYRPDRVVFDGDSVTIIDYKSGKRNDRHADQLITYAGYIADMGYKQIERALVYLEPEVQVVNV